MATFVYRIQPTRSDMLSKGPTEAEATVIGEHFTYLEALTDRGQVMMAGRTLNENEDAFGIVIFNAESEDEADRVALADPAVAQGVMSYELYPFRIALWSKHDPLKISS